MIKYLFILFSSFTFSQTMLFNLPAEPLVYNNQDNEWIDFFYGGRNIYLADTVTTSYQNNGFSQWQSNFAIDSTYIDATYKDAFVIKYNDGENFPKYVSGLERNDMLWYFGGWYATDEEELNSTIGFWVKRTELNGNGLIFVNQSGDVHILGGGFLSQEKYKSSFYGGAPYLWEVDKVVGDYSHIKFNIDESIYPPDSTGIYATPIFRMGIYPSSANEVTQLTIYNPTLIYSKRFNYNKRYESTAEKDTSLFIGKRIVYVGDSQYNDGYFHIRISDYTGARIFDQHWGGYRMMHSTTSWFYRDTIKSKIFDIEDVDVYFLPISSNDSYGGDTTEASIDSVIYYYPYYGDHADTVTAKLVRFNALSDARKDSIFKFTPTYCAYIEQIRLVNPTARIIIGSIPIGSDNASMTGGLDVNGYGIWSVGYTPEERILNVLPILELKRDDILEIVGKYDLEYIDLMGTFTDGVNNGDGVRMDFYNFHQFVGDGVHWDLQNGEIKKRIADLLKDYLK